MKRLQLPATRRERASRQGDPQDLPSIGDRHYIDRLMSTTASSTSMRAAAAQPGEAARRRLGLLALFAAVYTYALIVFGGIVRITGSGMGCGDDWPRCNGQWIPDFTLETLIEYTHRLLAAGIGLVVLAVFAYAIAIRRRPGLGGPGGLLRPLALGAALLVLQIVLGAVTVRLELPTEVTVAHFLTAMLFLATLLVAAVRADVFGAASAPPAGAARSRARAAAAAAVLGLIVVAFGAITANMPGAPPACQGFPLCNGALLPAATAPTVHIHWAHRLFAFLLFFHVGGAAFAATRKAGSRAVKRAAVTTAALIVAQLTLAAALVLAHLPRSLQALHLAAGVAIWCALVIWATLALRDARFARAGGRA
jgi:heme a synthase